MSHDNAYEPPSPPRDELLDLLDLLRRIADHDAAAGTIQADVRGYLQHLEAAGFSSGLLKDGPGATGHPQNPREVAEGLPRPRRATG